jgi:thioredoxin 2
MNDVLQIVCPHDDAINRLPKRRLDENPKCGKCHKPLFTGEPVDLTAARFDKHLGRNSISLLVDFWAPWCGPCTMMAPAYKEAARQLEPQVRAAKVDTEREQALAARFSIRSIPTLILFSGGREIARQSGAMTSAASIVAWVRMQATRERDAAA